MRAEGTMETPAAADHSNTPRGTHGRVVVGIAGAGTAIPRPVIRAIVDAAAHMLLFLGALRSVTVIPRAVIPARVLVSLLTSDEHAPCYQYERYHFRLFHSAASIALSLLNISATARERKAKEGRQREDTHYSTRFASHRKSRLGYPPETGSQTSSLVSRLTFGLLSVGFPQPKSTATMPGPMSSVIFAFT